jgi:hypothetical protein
VRLDESTFFTLAGSRDYAFEPTGSCPATIGFSAVGARYLRLTGQANTPLARRVALGGHGVRVLTPTAPAGGAPSPTGAPTGAGRAAPRIARPAPGLRTATARQSSTRWNPHVTAAAQPDG